MKPDGYPLPWNGALDEAYWKTNLAWCTSVDGWATFQSGKPMAWIISQIDRVMARYSQRDPGAQRSLR